HPLSTVLPYPTLFRSPGRGAPEHTDGKEEENTRGATTRPDHSVSRGLSTLADLLSHGNNLTAARRRRILTLDLDTQTTPSSLIDHQIVQHRRNLRQHHRRRLRRLKLPIHVPTRQPGKLPIRRLVVPRLRRLLQRLVEINNHRMSIGDVQLGDTNSTGCLNLIHRPMLVLITANTLALALRRGAARTTLHRLSRSQKPSGGFEQPMTIRQALERPKGAQRPSEGHPEPSERGPQGLTGFKTRTEPRGR